MKTIYLLFSFLGFIQIANAQTPTWSDNVACIIYSHCTSCHNPNGIGMGDFTNYTNVYNYRNIIKSSVDTKRMPPYPANTAYRHYTQERILSQSEIDILKTWIDNNAPSGNLAAAPTAPVYNTNYTMVNPDAIYTIPTYTINTMGGDVYRCFPIPSNMTSNKFISEIEVVPGNRQRVHHVLVFQDSLNTCNTLDANDPGPGYSSGGTGTNSATLVMGWTPGQDRYVYPTNFGSRIPANANIIVQIHYPLGILNETDSTKVLIKFATNTVRSTITSPLLNHSIASLQNPPLFIPANTTKTFVEKFNVPNGFDATILSVFPHMHKVGTAIKAFAVKANLDTIPLIDIPKWDFNWQGNYNFQKPIVIPGGSKLWAIATYDNTTNNPYNPNSPPLDVSKGEATTDEMMLVYFTYTASQASDENIIVDTASHSNHHLNCNANTITSIKNSNNQTPIFALHPNPNDGIFSIYFAKNIETEICIYNMHGQLIYNDKQYISGKSVSIQQFSRGIYVVKAKQKGMDVWQSKLVVE
jgi:Secretion system C-terminal sorting domain/Copper type II ascorbate-dependent monooxygenase, C-terminal domain